MLSRILSVRSLCSSNLRVNGLLIRAFSDFGDKFPPRQYDGERRPRQFVGERRPRQFDGERSPRQFDGERRPRQFDGERSPRQFDGERSPRQFDGERRPRQFDGERSPRQFDGERRPRQFGGERPRQFDGERSPRQLDGERRPRQYDGERRPRQFDGDSHAKIFDGERRPFMSDLERFRDRVASGKTINAWTVYTNIMENNPSSLEFLDHVKFIGSLRFSSLAADFKRMENIFENIEQLKCEIPIPVYETMIGRAWRFNPELTETFYDKMVKAHGDESVTGTVYAARMNAYRSAKQFDKALDLAKEAENRGIDIHQFKPIIMDVHYKLGDKTTAEATFNTYVAEEQQPLNIAKIHAWYANLLVDDGKLDEAKTLIESLRDRDVTPSHGALAVLMRIALAKNDLAGAREYIESVIRESNRETYSAAVTQLVQAHLDAGDFDGLEQFLSVYTKKYEELPTLRFRPYMLAMEYHANPENPGARGVVEVLRLFDMVPTMGKYNNEAILAVVVLSLAKMGETDRAKVILRTAHERGFRADNAKVNMALIETLSFASSSLKSSIPAISTPKDDITKMVNLLSASESVPFTETIPQPPAAEKAM